MRIAILSIAFLLLAFAAQSQVLKSAGVWYFLDVDSMAARPAVLPSGTELAYVVGTKKIYYWHRGTSTWTEYGSGSTFNRDSIYFDSSIIGSGTVSDPWGVDSTLFATIAGVGDSIAAALGYVAANFFPLQGGTLTGTGGNGFVGFPLQSSPPSTPATGFSLFAGSTGNNISWMQPDGFFRRLVSPVTGTPRQYQFMARSYTLGDSADIANNVTSIAANYIATSNGTNLVARNLFDNNTYVGVLNSKPWQFGQWTTAGRPTGTNGYTGFNTTFNWLDIYSSSGWFSPARAATTGGAFTATYVPFGGTGGLTENSGFTFSTSAGLNVTLGIVNTFNVSSNNSSSSAFNIENTSSGSKKWAFAVAGSSNVAPHGSFVFYDYAGDISLMGLDGAVGARRLMLNRQTNLTWSSGASQYALTPADIGLNRTSTGVLFLNNGTGATSATTGLGLAIGTTAQTPTEFNGLIRMNSDTGAVQIYLSGSRQYLATRAYARSLVAALPTTNIYTANGTLTGHRTVTSGGFDLTMTGKVKIGSDSSFIHNPSVDTTYAKGVFATSYMRSNASALYSTVGGVISQKTTYGAAQGAYYSMSSKSSSGWLGGYYASNLLGTGLNFEMGYEIYRNANRERYVAQQYILDPYTSFTENYLSASIDTAIVAPANWMFIRMGNKTNTIPKSLWFTSAGATTVDTAQFRFNNVNGQLFSNGKFFTVENAGSPFFVIRTTGTASLNTYGTGTKEAADLSKTQSNYNATFATDGTLLEIERKRDTTVYIDDADYDWSATITTAQIASRYNRVIFWMTTTAAAGSDSELTLHTPDVNLMQVEYLIHSVDEPAGFDNKIVFGTNNAVDSTNGLVTNYFPAAGDGIHIRAGLRSGVYKYRYSN